MTHHAPAATVGHVAALRRPGRLLVLNRAITRLELLEPGTSVPEDSSIIAGSWDVTELLNDTPGHLDTKAAYEEVTFALYARVLTELTDEPLPPSLPITRLRRSLASLGIHLDAAPAYWANAEERWFWTDYYVCGYAPDMAIWVTCAHRSTGSMRIVLFRDHRPMARWKEPFAGETGAEKVANSIQVAVDDYRDR